MDEQRKQDVVRKCLAELLVDHDVWTDSELTDNVVLAYIVGVFDGLQGDSPTTPHPTSDLTQAHATSDYPTVEPSSRRGNFMQGCCDMQYEDAFDVEGFSEMMSAYMPGFEHVPSAALIEWLFRVAAKLQVPASSNCESPNSPNLPRLLSSSPNNTPDTQNSVSEAGIEPGSSKPVTVPSIAENEPHGICDNVGTNTTSQQGLAVSGNEAGLSATEVRHFVPGRYPRVRPPEETAASSLATADARAPDVGHVAPRRYPDTQSPSCATNALNEINSKEIPDVLNDLSLTSGAELELLNIPMYGANGIGQAQRGDSEDTRQTLIASDVTRENRSLRVKPAATVPVYGGSAAAHGCATDRSKFFNGDNFDAPREQALKEARRRTQSSSAIGELALTAECDWAALPQALLDEEWPSLPERLGCTVSPVQNTSRHPTSTSGEQTPPGNQEAVQHNSPDSEATLREMFPGSSPEEIGRCLRECDQDLDRAVLMLLRHSGAITDAPSPQQKQPTSSKPKSKKKAARRKSSSNVTSSCEPDDGVKEQILSRYLVYSETKGSSSDTSPKPPRLPEEPKKLVRYLENQVVSTKGEKYKEFKKDSSEEERKTYINLKPARKYRFH